MTNRVARRSTTRKLNTRPATGANDIDKQSPRARRVSVICAYFNAAEYMQETLDSIAAQQFGDFELLLVNDGSTDSSGAIARKFAERFPDNVHCLAHSGNANRGVSASRNLGIREARGEFCAFIDADDRWRPAKLLEQLAIFDNNPTVDLVAGSASYWRSWSGGQDRLVRSGHVQNQVIKPPEASLKVYPLGRASAPCPSDLLVRTKLLRDVGGFEESFTGPITLYEDQAFLSKVYLCGNVYFDERVWLDYRLHDRSMMHEGLAAGRYHEVRKHFLNWYRAYVRNKRGPDMLRVLAALEWAYLRYRVSRLARTARRARRLWRRLSPF